MALDPITQKVKCPFCEGDGCCACDHSGKLEIGNGKPFETVIEVESHDLGISIFDLEIKKGLRNLETGKLTNP